MSAGVLEARRASWSPGTRGERPLAFALALLLSALGGAALWRVQGGVVAVRWPAPGVTVWLAPPLPERRAVPATPPPAPWPPSSQGARPARPRADAVRAPAARMPDPASRLEIGPLPLPAPTPEPPLPGPQTAPAATAADIASGQASAPAPLRLDLRQAAQAGREGARGWAERAGAALPAGPAPPPARLADELRRAGRRDCLAPDEHGSLLSLPGLLRDALTGDCR